MLRVRTIGRRAKSDPILETNAQGQEVLRHPLLNKGTAFP